MSKLPNDPPEVLWRSGIDFPRLVDGVPVRSATLTAFVERRGGEERRGIEYATNVIETPAEEGARILAEIAAMSDENGTDIGDWMAGSPRVLQEVPWLVALTSLVRRDDALVVRHVLPVFGGDRPADMSDEYIRTVDGQSEDERRKDLESRDELGTELHRRAMHYSTSTRLPQPTPRTHHAWIHRALLGEATEPTTEQMPHEHGTGCQWCEGGK